MLEMRDVMRNAAHGGHDQGPGEFRRCRGGTRAFGHDDAALGAGADIHMAADAPGLRNHFELGELFEQLARQMGSLPDQHDHIGILEPDRKLADALDGVGIDLGLVSVELGGTGEFAHCVLVIVKDHNVHADIVPASSAATRQRWRNRRKPDGPCTDCLAQRRGRGPEIAAMAASAFRPCGPARHKHRPCDLK